MLKRANIQWSAKTLYNQIEKGSLVFDVAIQRGLVWNKVQKCLLIHSMLYGYPIPPFYFSKRDDSGYDVLDGKQRSDAVRGYIGGEYALEGVPVVYDDNDSEADLNGLKFEEIPAWAQDRIKDYSLTIYYYEGITDEEVAELFFRINNGKPLSNIELTRVRAKSIESFQRIAKFNAISTAITEKGKSRYNDENTAMQVWAMCFTEKPDFTTAKFRPLIEASVVTDEQEKRLKNACAYLDVYTATLDPETTEDKAVLRKIKSRTHLVSCIYLAERVMDTHSSEEYCTMLNKFFRTGKRDTTTSEYYNQSAGAGSARADAIETRIRELNKLI